MNQVQLSNRSALLVLLVASVVGLAVGLSPLPEWAILVAAPLLAVPICLVALWLQQRARR